MAADRNAIGTHCLSFYSTYAEWRIERERCAEPIKKSFHKEEVGELLSIKKTRIVQKETALKESKGRPSKL